MRFNYEVINGDSNIAIATLWSSIGQVKAILGNSLGKVGLIGNLYTPVGINYMLATLARHGNVDTLILFGNDVNGVGDHVMRFFREGVLPRLLIPRDVAEEIRRTVKVIDLRSEYRAGNAGALLRIIEESYRPGARARVSREVVVEEPPRAGWDLPLMGALIYEVNTYRAWVKLVDLVLRFGVHKEMTDSSYREFLGVSVIIDGTRTENPFGRPVNEKSIRVNRDALEAIANALSEHPYSMNAVYRGEYLVQGVISGDYYGQVTYVPMLDVFGDWCRVIIEQWFLARAVVEELNRRFNAWYRVGNVGVVIFSARVKEDMASKAADFVRRNEGVFREFVEDPRGNFVIERENGHVVVEHRYPGTHELMERLTFNSIKEAYNYFKNRNYFTTYSHALYLGKELMRAFLKEDYTQDEV